MLRPQHELLQLKTGHPTLEKTFPDGSRKMYEDSQKHLTLSSPTNHTPQLENCHWL